jgi:methionine-rich copper-binding protein CopC
MSALRLLIALIAGVLIISLMAVSPAAAQIYIMESTVAAIRVGSALEMEATLSVPAGGQVRCVLPSGKTQTVKGPYSGRVADLTKGQPINEGVVTWIKNVLASGGATEARPGATRSAARAPEKVQMPFSWSSVPFSNATACVQKGAKLQLVRASGGSAEAFTVVDGATGLQAEGRWEASSTIADWPASVVPRTDITYYIQVPDRPRRQVVFKVLDKLPAEDDVLLELHRQGCSAQFEAWMRDKLAAAQK